MHFAWQIMLRTAAAAAVVAVAAHGARALEPATPPEPTPVAAVAPTIDLSPAYQLALVRGFIAGALGVEGGQVEIQAGSTPRPFALPTGGAPELRVEWDGQPGVARDGALRVRLVARSGGVEVASRPLALRARVYAEALVAARSLRQNEAIGPADVILRRVELTALAARPLAELGPAGHIASRPLRAGEAITERDARPAALVGQGAAVAIIVRRGALVARARGIAISGGALGDAIHVRNIDSRRIVEGRVVGPDQVEVIIP